MDRHALDTVSFEIAIPLSKETVSSACRSIEQGKIVGIVSRANLVQALASAISMITKTADADRAIRLEILSRLADQSWTDFGERNISSRRWRSSYLGSCWIPSRAHGLDSARRERSRA